LERAVKLIWLLFLLINCLDRKMNEVDRLITEEVKLLAKVGRLFMEADKLHKENTCSINF
jgi:hypothetical protein